MPMPGSWREGPAFNPSLPSSGTPDPALLDMFRGMRQDARADPQPTEVAQAFPVVLGFDGAGQLPAVGAVIILPLGNLKARITGAVIVANGIGSATIDLRLGTFSDAQNGTVLAPIYGVTGNIPKLTASAGAVLNINTWTLNLQAADVLIGTLTAITSTIASPSPGALTCVSLSIYCRRVKWPSGGTTLTDTAGDTLTTAGGSTVQLRS